MPSGNLNAHHLAHLDQEIALLERTVAHATRLGRNPARWQRELKALKEERLLLKQLLRVPVPPCIGAVIDR